MPFMDKPGPGGFLPTHDTRIPDQTSHLSSFDVWINSLPDWPIFQYETVGGLIIAGLLILWVRHIERTPKPSAPERQAPD
jgi:hypothetical protein